MIREQHLLLPANSDSSRPWLRCIPLDGSASLSLPQGLEAAGNRAPCVGLTGFSICFHFATRHFYFKSLEGYLSNIPLLSWEDWTRIRLPSSLHPAFRPGGSHGGYKDWGPSQQKSLSSGSDRMGHTAPGHCLSDIGNYALKRLVHIHSSQGGLEIN